jgi:hypothetical protein
MTYEQASKHIQEIDEEICEQFKQMLWDMCIKNGVPSAIVELAFRQAMVSVKKKERILHEQLR